MTPDRLIPICADYRCALPEHQRPRAFATPRSMADPDPARYYGSGQGVRPSSGVPLERDGREVTGHRHDGSTQGKAGDRTKSGRPPTRMARKWMAHEVMPGYSGRAATGTDRAGTALGVAIVLLIVIAIAASLVAVR